MRPQDAYLHACLSELEALKPGNVHVFADGHGMQVQDFIASAQASAPALCDDAQWGVRGLGQRILQALQTTHQQVACNTNLGIVLLAAPIVQAVLQYAHLPLQSALQQVLQQTTVQDAQAVYQGIRLVKPAGMGQRGQHDVADNPNITLLAAMQEVYTEDSIARQYCHGYADIWQQALPLYQAVYERWQRPAWALTAVYLFWMSHWPDSHIARKFGLSTAQYWQQQSQQHYAQLMVQENPKRSMSPLLKWDSELKQAGINPGTSADLTVVTAMLAQLVSSH